jgi:phospholipid/cholesterol/gamma-HCH transport system substrate-binding protein
MMTTMRSPMFWGVTALVMTTIISLGVAMVYVTPPRQQIVTFYTDDVVSVHPGDTVRIAGIVVGKVKDRSLERNQVRVRVSVDKDAFVGDESQIEVRMLTVVGGYFVTIIPLGDSRLGARAIPKERVTMPYSLIRTLADTTKFTEHVAPKPIRESIDQMQQGLTGSNVDTISTVINAGNSITDTLEQQRGELSKILDLSDEYIDRLSNYRDQLQYMIRRVATVEQSLILYGKQFGIALRGIGNLIDALSPVGDFYINHQGWFLEKVRRVLKEFRTIADRNGVVVRVLQRIHSRMEVALGAQNNATPPQLLATDLCIPVERTPC